MFYGERRSAARRMHVTRGMDAVHLQAGEISVSKLIAVFAATCGALALLPAVVAACTSSDPHVVWMTGLEHGVASTISGQPFVYGSNGGLPGGADSTIQHAGSYSLRLASNGSAISYRDRVLPTAPTGMLVERFYIRLDSPPPTSNVRELAAVYSTSHTTKNSSSPRYAAHLGYKASSGKLTMELNTQNPGTPVEATVPMTPLAWHLVEIRYDVASGAPYGSTTTHKVDWSIDGVPQTQVTLGSVPSTFINEITWGTTFTGDAFAANYDDLMLSQTAGDYPLGGGRILRLGPNDSNGPHSGVQNFKDVDNGVASDIGPTTWQGLTDVPFSVPGRHIAQIANSSASYVQLGFDDTAEPCIRAVSGWVAWDPQNTKFDNNGTTKVVDGSIASVIWSGYMSYTSTQPWIRTAMVSPPTDTGVGWTPDRVNGLVARVGYSTDTSPRPWWDALMLEYEASP
jgi:hypothetical protein